ncbi:MAG: hypothetical protein ABI181_03520 [Mycobacteriaceae bacterium]
MPPPPPETSPEPHPGPPAPLVVAGLLTGVEGLVALAIAIVLAVRELLGVGDQLVSGYALAAMFAVLGGGVLASGVSLSRGQRGGRAPTVIMQVVLAPVAWSLLRDSGVPIAGAVLGLVALAVLVLSFWPSSVAWTGERFTSEHPPVPDPGLSPRASRSVTSKQDRSGPRAR